MISPDAVSPENALLMEGWKVQHYTDSANELNFTATPRVAFISGGERFCLTCNRAQPFLQYDHRQRRIRDVPMHGKSVLIFITEPRFRCKECKVFFKPKHVDLSNEFRMTARCEAYVQIESLRRPFATVAREVGIDEKTVRIISSIHAAECETSFASVPWSTRFLGIDDIYLNKKSCTILVDLETRRPLDIIEGYEKADLTKFLNAIGQKSREMIKVVCMDMASHFSYTIAAVLPKATIIYDKWHVQRQAFTAMDMARNQLQRYVRANAGNNKRAGRRASKIIADLQKHRALFRHRHFHKFKDGHRVLLQRYLDEYPGLSVAYSLKEQFCDIWSARSVPEAEDLIDNWRAALAIQCDRFETEPTVIAKAVRRRSTSVSRPVNKTRILPEADPAILFRKAERSVNEGRLYVLNYFSTDERLTNAVTEAINGLIKLVQRTGRGYQFEQLRARVLHKTPEAARVRKSVPRRGNRTAAKKPYSPLNGGGAIAIVRSETDRPMVKCHRNGCFEMLAIKRSVDSNGNDSYLSPVDNEYCLKCQNLLNPVRRRRRVNRYEPQTELFGDTVVLK